MHSNIISTACNCLRDFFAPPRGLTHHPPDFGVLTLRRGPVTLRPFLHAPQALQFTLSAGSLAFVRPPLPLVGGLLAVVGDTVALVGYAFSLVSDALAPAQVPLAARERRLTVISLSSAPT